MTYNKSHKKHKVCDNSNNNDIEFQLDADTYIIDNLDQKLLELLIKGYENKKIATEVKTPLSTIERRIRKIFENQYIRPKVLICSICFVLLTFLYFEGFGLVLNLYPEIL